MPRRFLVPALSVVLALAIGPAAPVAAAPGCDPFQTPPQIDPAVPTAQSVLGFALGSKEVSAAQANQYMAAVDAAMADLLARERELLAELPAHDRKELAALLRRLLAPFET